jgi:hypothetical protein
VTVAQRERIAPGSAVGAHSPARGRAWLADLVTAGLAVFLWLTFRPALMSPDSVEQYRQALAGAYNDWHPPLMAVALHLVFRAGRGLAALMLVQCVAGAFGVRALASAMLRWGRRDREAGPREAWLAVAVLLALLVPVTPLAFYLMTFWKDAWAAIAMVWLGALLLELERRGPSVARGAAALTAATILTSTRHNALVVLPVVGIALWWTVPRPRRWGAVALAIAPLVAYGGCEAAVRQLFAVQRAHVEDEVMMLDLVGLCAADRDDCRELPWTAGQVLGHPALEAYRPGDRTIAFWKAIQPVEAEMWRDRADVEREYHDAWRRFPLRLAGLKAAGFASLLGLRRTDYFFQATLVDNPYGLAQMPAFGAARELLVRSASAVAASPLLRWVSGSHAVWLLVDVAGVAWLAARGRRRRDGDALFLALVLLLPASYYLSYLVAAPVPDFRFMYPATLFVETACAAALLGRLGRSRESARAAATPLPV